MQQLANLDCFYLARELDEALANAFFENFYNYGAEGKEGGTEGVFRIRFAKPNESVLVDLKGFAFIAPSEAFPEPPKQPSSFAMLLRKHFEGGRLARVTQPNFERILEFEFSSKNGARFLAVELFGKEGNLLLLDAERRIIAPFKTASYAHRTLRRGEAYALPPSEKKHPLELKEGDVQGKGKVVSFLSKQTSLAPFYLEEACARAGVALETKAEELGEKSKDPLLKAIASLFEKPSPSLYSEGGKPFAFSCTQMRKLQGLEEKRFATLSQAEGEYYSSLHALTKEQEAAEEKKGKIAFQLEAQEKALREFETKAGELQKAGKWVFENHEIAEQLIEAAKKNKEGLHALARKMGFKTAGAKGLVLELETEGG